MEWLVLLAGDCQSQAGERQVGAQNSTLHAPPDGMCAVQQALYETVRKRDPAQSEFLQAVEEARAPHLSKALPSTPAEDTVMGKMTV